MKDIEGKELKIGDEVVINYSYKDLRKYVITRFTPCGIKVKTSLTDKYEHQCLNTEQRVYKINKE